MDQVMIGKFIAAERKQKGYTQRQLANELGISDKTISKWETGNGFPEISLMLPFCECLEITVNELLSGQRLSENEYKQKAEENMVNIISEAQENKKKIIVECMVCAISVLASITLILLAGSLDIGIWLRVVLIAISIVIMISGISAAVILDVQAGSFECPNCNNKFVPSTKEYVFGMHTITKRKLTCPRCGERSYCRKVLTK